jgi:hypothetical protein
MRGRRRREVEGAGGEERKLEDLMVPLPGTAKQMQTQSHQRTQRKQIPLLVFSVPSVSLQPQR